MTSTNAKASGGQRRYNSALRARQAERTRVEIVLAAARLFARSGWAGTTLAAIAEEAGVSVDTIYSGFGTKKALLNPAMDVATTGDAEPVPLSEREEFLRLPQLPQAERLRAGLEFATRQFPTSSGVWSAMVQAAGGDAEVAGWCEDLERRRRQTWRDFLQLVFERQIAEVDLDAIWAISSMEVYAKLTRERGWSHAEWLGWLIESVPRCLPAGGR